MRRLLKLLHTIGATGLLGSMASLYVMSLTAPPASAVAAYAAVRTSMSAVATWLFLPSLVIVLLAGLLALAVTRAFHDAGWVWIKLASGLALFEGGLQTLQAPIRDEAARASSALVHHAGAASDGFSASTEQAALGVLLVVALGNVALGTFRPRVLRLPD